MTYHQKRKFFTDEEKEGFIQDYLKSPLSLKDYVTHHGIGLSTLTSWGRKLSISLNKKRKFSKASPLKEEKALSGKQGSPLFVDLTQSFQGKSFSLARQESQDLSPSLSLVLSVPGGITITLERVAEDQAARFVKGLL